jgi:hypothetical protein
MTRGQNLPRKHKIQIVRSFSLLADIDFPQDFTQQCNLVVKLFDDNIDVLEPFASVVHIKFDL